MLSGAVKGLFTSQTLVNTVTKQFYFLKSFQLRSVQYAIFRSINQTSVINMPQYTSFGQKYYDLELFSCQQLSDSICLLSAFKLYVYIKLDQLNQ